MNRSLAAIAAAAMFAASVPSVGFADESSSSSVSSVESSSASSVSSQSSVSSAESSSSDASGPSWMRPCRELSGLKKAQCISKHNPGKGNKKDRVQRRTEDKALRINGDCSSMEGPERLKCVRKNGKRGIKSFIQKKSKYDQEHTIRGVKARTSSSASSED